MYAVLQYVLLYKNMSIKSIFARAKDWCLENERELVLMSAFLLISAISFGLGILWQKNRGIKAPITINRQNLAANVIYAGPSKQAGEVVAIRDASTDNISDVIFIASKKGKYYHLPECAGAKAIKPENKIEFRSREEAEKAGYKPAGNCPGLMKR